MSILYDHHLEAALPLLSSPASANSILPRQQLGRNLWPHTVNHCIILKYVIYYTPTFGINTVKYQFEYMHPNSLEHHLAQSIRKAKQKVMNSSLSHISTPGKDMLSTSQTNSAVALAMKALQDRITALERNNQELQNQIQTSQSQKQKLKRQLIEIDVAWKVERQRARQRQNQNSYKRQDIQQHVLPRQTVMSPMSDQEEDQALALEVRELKQRNAINHQKIQALMKQLQEQKQKNLKWAKLYGKQLQNQQKQNDKMVVNRKSKPSNPKTQTQLKSINNQLKQTQQKFFEIRLLAVRLVELLNKLPYISSQIRNLSVKIMRFQDIQPEKVFTRNSNSKIFHDSPYKREEDKKGKRSLKISDLNSSNKKSGVGYRNSNSKSHTNSNHKIDQKSIQKLQGKRSRKNILTQGITRQSRKSDHSVQEKGDVLLRLK